MSSIACDLKPFKAIVFDVDGVLSPSVVPVNDDGTPARMANVKDGFAMQLALRHDIKIAIITGGISETVRRRFEIIGVSDLFMGISDKLPVLKKWMADNALLPEEVIYVGDDLPDYHCMRYVGLSVAPSDAATEIKQVATYISPHLGGHGVARDVIEHLMKAKGLWMTSDKCFIW